MAQKNRSMSAMLIAVLIGVVIAAVYYFAAGPANHDQARLPAPKTESAGIAMKASDEGGLSMALRDDDMVLGDPAAPVTIIEYASLTCPHCAYFHTDSLPTIKKNWIETGKAKLIFRDFPLDQWALRASMIAHCSGKERFFPVMSMLFKQQGQWAAAQEPLTELTKIARFAGMGEEQVNACLEDKALEDSILAERLDAANNFGIDSTPSFVIGGKKYAGALSPEEMDKILESASPGN